MRPLVAVAFVAVLGTCYAARLENTYLPPGSAGSAGGAGLIQAPNRGGAGGPVKIAGPAGAGPFGGSPAGNNNQYVPPSGAGGHGGVGGGQGAFGLGGSGGAGGAGGSRGGGGGGAGPGQDIPIVSYSNENSGDGNYQFSYETGNGISAQETGHLQGETEAVSGSYSYTGPDGVQYSITYTADEEGFHPQGAHLPTPPPIPPEIQRGVELALAAEARGENQDGSSGSGGAGYPQGGPSAFPGAGRGGAGSRGSGGSPVYQGPNSYQTSSGGGYRY